MKIIITLILSALSNTLFACIEPPIYSQEDLINYIKYSEYAFVGRVIKIETDEKFIETYSTDPKKDITYDVEYDVQKVSYEVIHSLKGKLAQERAESNIVMSSTCSFGVDKEWLGEIYIVTVSWHYDKLRSFPISKEHLKVGVYEALLNTN